MICRRFAAIQTVRSSFCRPYLPPPLPLLFDSKCSTGCLSNFRHFCIGALLRQQTRRGANRNTTADATKTSIADDDDDGDDAEVQPKRKRAWHDRNAEMSTCAGDAAKPKKKKAWWKRPKVSDVLKHVSMPEAFVTKVHNWMSLLEEEIDEQTRRIRESMQSGTIETLVRSGTILGNIRFVNESDNQQTRMSRIVRFTRVDARRGNSFSRGDPVAICLASQSLRLDHVCRGTISAIDDKMVELRISTGEYASLEKRAGWRTLSLLLIPSDAQVVLERLRSFVRTIDETMIGAVGETILRAAYRSFLLPFTIGKHCKYAYLLHITDQKLSGNYCYQLNTAQQEAVCCALNADRPFVTIQGPPGTGKTLVVAEIVRQAIKRNLKVLVCAPSNVAVDNVLLRLKDHVTLVRLGASNDDDCQSLTLDTQLLRIRENMSITDITDAKLESHQRELLHNASVMFSTLGNGSINLIHRHQWTPDLIIVDEAAQAMECETWLPLLKGRRCVLIGDHCQLPPVITSNRCAELRISLLEYLSKEHKMSNRLLNVQYRMNEKIMNWSSRNFYDSKMKTDPSIANIRLSDISNVPVDAAQNSPLLMIDTSLGVDRRLYAEKMGYDKSIGNVGEADLVYKYLQTLLSMNVAPHNIGIITPYDQQARMISKLLTNDQRAAIMVNTVDSYQGQEKEAIILSMVRSNYHGKVGFLSDERRLNVAVTRAKRHLAVIGNRETLITNRHIESLIKTIALLGVIQSAKLYE